jgi:dTDP-4-dehydrorhamnose reductase
MKFLVTGSTGLIGSQVVKDLTVQNHTVYSCYHNEEAKHGSPVKLDLINKNSIQNTIDNIKPDCIIHLAAITDVNLCETQQDLAMKINANSTKAIAQQASKNKSFFVYVSTDYVFDGKIGMRKEDDVPKPLGIYGESKLAGELAINNLASPYAIARTSTPFGWYNKKKTFPIWIKESLQSKKEIPVLVDQFTSPTYVPNLSKMLIEVATRQISGIIHLAGATRISRFTLAELVADKLNLDKKLLIPTTIDEMSWKAQRPKDSSLDVSLASEILHEKPMKIEQSLDLLFSSQKND